jgi:hypothetical protein
MLTAIKLQLIGNSALIMCACDISTGPATWRDAKVIGDVAYIVADEADHGLQVFDLTQLRGKTDFSTSKRPTSTAALVTRTTSPLTSRPRGCTPLDARRSVCIFITW